jgi:hypothetical protein
MGLKLTIGKGDKVVIGDTHIVIDCLTTSNKQTCLEFHAPRDVRIDAVFADSSKMFKNAIKASVKAIEPDDLEARRNPDILIERDG